jgi:hypothetical protein
MNAQPVFKDHRGRPMVAKPKSQFAAKYAPFLVSLLMIVSMAGLTGAVTTIDLTNQVRNVLGTGNGGTGTASTLTGLVRGGNPMTAAELSGDCSTSGSNVATCAKINGTSIPTNSAANQVAITTGAATGAWATLGDTSAGALAETYNGTTHAFGTISVLSGTFADAEVPSGTINSSNVTFTLAHTPSPAGSLNCFENGVQQRAGGADYTLSTGTITYGIAPPTGSTLDCFYRY